eukprot:scaffold14682_cov124-Isochrysis_galbana.AAC.4
MISGGVGPTRITRSSALAAQRESDNLPAPIWDERGSKERHRITLRTLVDNKVGEDLDEWLNTNELGLRNSRIFYVVQSRWDVERGVFKFGFANRDGAARLRSYVYAYGRGDVRVHILLKTAYNTNVTRESSFMYRLELRLKRKLRDEIKALGRGDERVAVPLGRLRQLLYLEAEGDRGLGEIGESERVLREA